jgi:hypothetical protein
MISQNAEVHRNTFDSGLNKDSNKTFIEDRQYTDAQNVSVIETSNFFALQNIRGTTKLQTIANDILSISNGGFNQPQGALLSPWYNSGTGTNLLDNNWFVFGRSNPEAIMTGANAAYTTPCVSPYLTQNFPIINGVTYSAGFSFRLPSFPIGSTVAGTVSMYFSDGVSRELVLQKSFTEADVATTFTESIEYEAQDDYDRMEIQVEITSISLTGTFALNLDNVVLSTIASPFNTIILGAFESRYKIGDVKDIKCITFVTATYPGFYKIWCYDTINNQLYQLYEEATPDDYITDDRIVDGFLYPENGLDILYITDNYFDIRKIRCEIPLPYTANFLNKYDITLIRRGANGYILPAIVFPISGGGSLLTGTYQFAYQMVDPITNKSTKWSLLSNPITVYTDGFTAGVGLGSNKKINLTITLGEDELDNFTHFRVAVIENIYPEGTPNLNASVTETYAVADYTLSVTTITNFQFSSNLQNNIIPLADIVVDNAAISHVKTIITRDNRLIAGNITYKNLEYDNGEPEIASGSIIKSNAIVDKTGHFRTEVYRYAISYFDDAGNYAVPRMLDMTSVQDNQIVSSLSKKDMKFPARSFVGGGTRRYSVLEGTNPVQLGLRLTGIDNHPTWARGFIILRAKRRKNILWQSPLVPMMSVYGIGSLARYPEQARLLGGATEDYPTAKPMGPSTTFVPMNLYWPQLRAIEKNTVNTGSGINTRRDGEAMLVASRTELTYDALTGNFTIVTKNVDQSLSMVFPPQTMYTQNSKYAFNASHRLETIDACLLVSRATPYSTNVNLPGNYLNTSISATFYALKDDLYYYDANHSGFKATLRPTAFLETPGFKMNGYKDFDNFSEGTSINGKDIMIYSNLTSDDITWEGIKPPAIQRCAVVDIDPFRPINSVDPTLFIPNLTFARSGTLLTSTWNANPTTFAYSIEFGDPQTTFINTMEIVNCVRGLDDNRYGDPEAQLEFIFTGTKVLFTDAEVATVKTAGSLPKTVDVWGGDCIVAPHIFKISDTVPSVPNANKHNGFGLTLDNVATNWGKAFRLGTTDAAITLPVFVKNAEQFLELVLETDVNGYILDTNQLTNYTDSNAAPRGNKKEGNTRTPLSYNYNINISKENDQKLFFTLDELTKVDQLLKARIIYSDIKVYQSNIEGFDVFKVNDYYDLSETYGEITKLVVASDSTYALQEFATSFIGIGERVLETTDASQLAVRTGDIIGNVIIIDSTRGSQHLGSVKSDGKTVFYADNHNKTINKIEGQQLSIISDMGMASEFREKFGYTIPTRELIGVYDPLRREYWIAQNDGSICYVYNDLSKKWISNYDFASGGVFASVFTNNNLYILGQDVSTELGIHTMYTGPISQLMGRTVIPSVTFIINPKSDLGKTFDNILINANDKLNDLSVVVRRERSLGDQSVSNISLLGSTRGEGNYRVKLPAKQRLRGLNAEATITWRTDYLVTDEQVALSSVLTKYRLSQNIF